MKSLLPSGHQKTTWTHFVTLITLNSQLVLFLLFTCRGGRFVVFDHAAFSDVRGEKCEMKLHGTNKNVFRLFLLQNYQGKRVEFLFRTETQ